LKIVPKGHLSTITQKTASGALVLPAKKPNRRWIIFAGKNGGNRRFVDPTKQFRKGSFFEQPALCLFI